MKTKKILARVFAMATLAACVSFAGCKSLYDVAPKAYGDWDGNYIYRGNVRSKTTGEDDEYLIESVTHNGVEYTVTDTTDFTYVGDDIYLCLMLRSETEETSSCFTRYNVKDKTSEVLYFKTDGLSAYQIYKMTDSFVILADMFEYGGQYNNNLFRIDYEGNVLSKNTNELYSYVQAGEYLLKLEDGKFSYRTWENDALTEMFTLPHKVNNFQAQYVERNEKTGFLIKIHSTDDQDQNLGGVYFYDLTGTMYELIGLKDRQECYLEGDYILTGERVDGTYQYASTLWERRDLFFFQIAIPRTEMQVVDYSMVQNCKLYKIDWAAEEELLKEVYDFTEKYKKLDFSDYTLLDNGRIFFEAKEMNLGGGCNGDAGMEYPYFMFDSETENLKKTYTNELEMTEEKRLQNAIKGGVSCGDYVYYEEQDFYGRKGYYVVDIYKLCRYNVETETLETMQFWRTYTMSSENDYEVKTGEGTVRYRWAPKMWRYADGASDFIVRNY